MYRPQLLKSEILSEIQARGVWQIGNGKFCRTGYTQNSAGAEPTTHVKTDVRKSCEFSQYKQCTLHSLSPFSTPRQ